VSLPFERVFSMGAFDALRTYRRQAVTTPELGQERLIQLAQALVGDATGLDFLAAIEIHSVVLRAAPHEPPYEFYRHCIFGLVLAQKMSWGKSITLGRRLFYGMLARDEQACFRAGRLMDDPPTADVVEWWDQLEGAMRAAGDAVKKERSRRAERLTFEHELYELTRLGISQVPKWIAVDDNTAGYDVLSFRPGEGGPVNLLIEVKSTIASPLRFFISRNEWDRALEMGDAYIFHIWDLAASPCRLFVFTKEQIEPHIPTDREGGKWVSAEIPLGAV
jgi:hypothetical protein